jgi:hypothetical protein
MSEAFPVFLKLQPVAGLKFPASALCKRSAVKFNFDERSGWSLLSTQGSNLCSITTIQAAIIALFRVVNRYVGNLPPMPGVFPLPGTGVINSEPGQVVPIDAVR